MYKIEKYEKNYDKEKFYSIMGKFFAERIYKKEMPYLINDNDKSWYLFFDNNELVGFCSVNKIMGGISFTDIYVTDNYRNSNALKFICNYMFKLHNKQYIRVLTFNCDEIKFWKSEGFKKIGTKGRYQILEWSKLDE